MSSKDHFDINFDDDSEMLSQEFFNELFARYAEGDSDQPIYLNRNPEGGYSQVLPPDHQESEYIPLGVEAHEDDESEDELLTDEESAVEPEAEPVGKRQIAVEEPVGKRQRPAEAEEEPRGRRVISGDGAPSGPSEEPAEEEAPQRPARERKAAPRQQKEPSIVDTLKEGLFTILSVIVGLFLLAKNKISELLGLKPKKKRKARPAGQSAQRPAGEGGPAGGGQGRPRKPLTPEQREARRKRRLRQRRIAQAKLIGIFLVLVLLFVLLVKGCSKDKSPSGTPGETSAPSTGNTTVTNTATIAVVGDIMTHGSQINDAYNEETDTYDFSYCLENVAEDLKSADFTMGNLETAMAGGTPSGHPLFNSPDALATDLAELGFDMVTTANNHCLDQTFEGLCSTLDKLDAAGIGHVGTHRSQEEYDANKGVFYTDINGIKVAFVSYTFSVNGNLFLYDYSVNLFNTDFEGAMETLDTERIKEEMAYAESLNPDLIIACMHWGVEYKTEPNSYQKYIADYMIAQGADVVLGGHPHVPEPIEYRTTVDDEGNEVTGLVVYSLGNFISGQTPEVCGPYTQDTAILNLEIQKTSDGKTSVSALSYTPLYFLNRGEDADVQYRMYKIDDAIADYEAGTPDEYVTEEVYETLKQSKQDLANILGTQWTVK